MRILLSSIDTAPFLESINTPMLLLLMVVRAPVAAVSLNSIGMFTFLYRESLTSMAAVSFVVPLPAAALQLRS